MFGRAVTAQGCAAEQRDPDGDGVCSDALDTAYCVAANDNCDTIPNRDQRNPDRDRFGSVRRACLLARCDIFCLVQLCIAAIVAVSLALGLSDVTPQWTRCGFVDVLAGV